MAEEALSAYEQRSAILCSNDAGLSEQLRIASMTPLSETRTALIERLERRLSRARAIDSWPREKFLNECIRPCNSPDTLECSICKDKYDNGTHKAVRFTHGCNHAFGEDCIRIWLKMPGSNTCPCCRTQLFLYDHDGFDDYEDGLDDDDEDLLPYTISFSQVEPREAYETREPRTFTIFGLPSEFTADGGQMPTVQTISSENIADVAERLFDTFCERRARNWEPLDKEGRREVLVTTLQNLDRPIRISWTLFNAQQWNDLDLRLESFDTIDCVEASMEFSLLNFGRSFTLLQNTIEDAFEAAGDVRMNECTP